MTSISWSPQQNEALSKAAAWLRLRYAPTFYLAGYAGTGKSTLALHVAAQERGEVRFAAFTGKAARVMRSKGCRGAKTIHSMIYKAQTDAEGRTLRDFPTACQCWSWAIRHSCRRSRAKATSPAATPTTC
jgi:hypothetical protein